MSATTILLIRHGVCDSVHHRLNGRLPGVHLTEEGKAQAKSLIERLTHQNIQAIYSSPLERTLETAAPLAHHLNLSIQTLPEFYEVNFGEWTGRSFTELNHIPAWSNYNVCRSSARIPGGESFLEVQTRVHQGLEKIRRAHRGETVAVFSHADVIRTALVHTLGMSLDHLLRIEVSPGSVSTIQIQDWGPHLLGTNFSGVFPAISP